MPLDESGRLGDDGSSLFVEPMRYMEDAVLGRVSGKLYCPQCAPPLLPAGLAAPLYVALDCSAASSRSVGAALCVSAAANTQSEVPGRDSAAGLLSQPGRWCSGPTSARRCKAKLGSFNWAGMRNCRDELVVPAFQLHLSRMDKSLPLAAPAQGFAGQAGSMPI